jgi:hypothetical protein
MAALLVKRCGRPIETNEGIGESEKPARPPIDDAIQVASAVNKKMRQ